MQGPFSCASVVSPLDAIGNNLRGDHSGDGRGQKDGLAGLVLAWWSPQSGSLASLVTVDFCSATLENSPDVSDDCDHIS